MEKVKTYSKSQVQKYEVAAISQASAAQRAGRAGRSMPGHCYRIYSLAALHSLDQFKEPEIRRVPVEQVVLLLKTLRVPDV